MIGVGIGGGVRSYFSHILCELFFEDSSILASEPNICICILGGYICKSSNLPRRGRRWPSSGHYCVPSPPRVSSGSSPPPASLSPQAAPTTSLVSPVSPSEWRPANTQQYTNYCHHCYVV